MISLDGIPAPTVANSYGRTGETLRLYVGMAVGALPVGTELSWPVGDGRTRLGVVELCDRQDGEVAIRFQRTSYRVTEVGTVRITDDMAGGFTEEPVVPFTERGRASGADGRAHVLAALRAAWERAPVLRLGQLVVAAAGAGVDVFALEDARLCEALEGFGR